MKLLLSTIIIAGLSACSSPPPVNYYQLSMPIPAAVPVQDTAAEQRLNLQPVKVANYLNGAGLVMQRSDVELIIASRHLWADALDQQLFRLLAEQVQARLPTLQLAKTNSADSVQLQLTIDRFHAQADGVAIVSGYYTLASGNDRVTQPFSYQQPLAADGYPALVTALSLSWQQVVTDIIADIEQRHL